MVFLLGKALRRNSRRFVFLIFEMKNDLKIFAKTIEESAREQIEKLLEVEVFDGSRIRIMGGIIWSL